MMLNEWVEAYALAHDIRDSTVEQYKVTASVLERWAGKRVKVSQLSDDLVNRFLRDYGQRKKPHTVQSKRRQLLALWRAAAEDGLCQQPKRVRAIKLPQTQRDVWDSEQVRRLVASLEQIRGRIPVSEIATGAALGALVRAAWDTGMRRSDLLRLTRGHAEHDGWLEMVQRKTNRVVLFRLSKATRAAILRTFDDWAPPRQFIWPQSLMVVRRMVYLIADTAEDIGLGSSRSPMKKLRRSSITAVEQQSPGSGYLHAGHATQDTTIRYYLNPTIAQMAKPMPPEL